MDVGLQVYQGAMFTELMTQGGKVFLDLPMYKSHEARTIQNNPQNQVNNN